MLSLLSCLNRHIVKGIISVVFGIWQFYHNSFELLLKPLTQASVLLLRIDLIFHYDAKPSPPHLFPLVIFSMATGRKMTDLELERDL